MAISNSIENFEMHVNEKFLAKARELTPALYRKKVTPTRLVKIASDEKVVADGEIGSLPERTLGKGDSVTLDFGDHYVGHVTFTLSPVGSPPDAPAYLHLKFAETPFEILENSDGYEGSISRGWIQEEYLHFDVLPVTVTLPRRYAFRYFYCEAVDTSAKYRVALSDVSVMHETSADASQVRPISIGDEELMRMDRVSCKTMEDCMQSVFEDGPKRDRRLWIGDLRLQALTNYYTFRNTDLVKRCLYLFAALTQNEERVGACLFLEPSELVDDTALFDYSLFFVSCLYDYYAFTGDKETLKELFPTAQHQIELALNELDEHSLVKDKETWWCFLDWKDGLNKQAGAQAILIYALKQMRLLSDALEYYDRSRGWKLMIDECTRATMDHLWDEKQGFFVSGEEKQVSWASQVWFVLARVFDDEQNAALLDRLMEKNPEVGMVTPYMVHHFVEALFQSGKKDEAVKQMKAYWGGMLSMGADTFWELYDPKDPYVSPYGSRIVNSFCHAWSGTPAYFIRKYLI